MERPLGKKNILNPAYARSFMLTYLINVDKGYLFDEASKVLTVIEKEVNKLSYEDCFVAMILVSKFHEEEDYLSIHDGRNYYELENNLNDRYIREMEVYILVKSFKENTFPFHSSLHSSSKSTCENLDI